MTSFQTFETTGTVDENGVLKVEPFVGVPAGRVRVSVAIAREEPLDYDDSEPTPEQLTAMSMATFVGWDDPAEDIYSWDESSAQVEESPTPR